MGHNASIHLDWGVFFEIEIEAGPVCALLPPGILPAEPAPGRALLSVNLVHFLGCGDQVQMPENHEIDIGIAVPVDNAGHAGLPQAASAVCLLNIASTSEDYLQICRDSGYPVHVGRELRFDIGPDGLSGSVHDADGPLLSFHPGNGARVFSIFSRIGQDLIHDHRGEYRLNYVLEGEGLAQPATDTFDLTLHAHPFYRRLDIAGAAARCRAQFALQPGRKASIAFYGPDA